MTSKLVLDNLAGRTTAGSIAVVAEGNGTTTNMQQGLAKHWVWTASGASPADSFNTTSVTDNSTGNYTITITNDMASVNYSATVSKLTAGSGRDVGVDDNSNMLVGSYVIYSTSSSSVEDKTCWGTVHGDLA